jgi:hypothetical protein
MKNILIIAGAAVLVLLLAAAIIMLRRRPRRLKTVRFQEQWRDLQKLCASKDTWPQAIINADKLLDEALKRRRFGGKSMGERLTKAQHVISDNEGVWFGHKLRSKLEADTTAKLKESEVKQALLGIRQALKDLGAFPHDS